MPLVMRQLADLVLGSVPTIILFLLVILAYWALVYRPLTRVLEERRRRTEGMMEQARMMLANAEARAQDYETRIRAARLEVFHAREERLAQWDRDREAAIAAVAEAAVRKVEEARALLAAETTKVEGQIEAGAAELGRRVLSAILPRGLAGDLAVSGNGH